MRTAIARLRRLGFTVASVSVMSFALMMSLLWFLGNPGEIHACKCAVPGTPSEELETSQAVFAGRVVSIQHSFDPNAASVSPEDRTTVGFEVSTVWKGIVYEDMYITTPPTGGSCGFTFIEREEYIVYGYDSNYDDGGYTVGICSRTALLGLAQADLEAFGAGHAPQAGTGGPVPEQPQDTARDGVEDNFSFDFESDAEEWLVGFADLPVDYDQSTFELDYGHRPLPDSLEGSGIYVQGHNRSADLFMFLKRQVGGLMPSRTYVVSVSMDLATSVPAGLVGIGGSPGESVFVKAGAATVEPTAEEGDNRHLRMNIDKGNQAQGGESMVVLGNMAHREVQGMKYRIKTLDNSNLPLVVDTDSAGRVWLIVGTDSGFEGLSALYFSRINYTLSTVEPPATGGYRPPVWAAVVVVGIAVVLAVVGLGWMVHSRRLSRRGMPPLTNF